MTLIWPLTDWFYRDFRLDRKIKRSPFSEKNKKPTSERFALRHYIYIRNIPMKNNKS